MIAYDQLIGTRFEKCLVEKLIGRGGYGLTFLAYDEELQEHRVIKISQVLGLDEISRQRHLKSFLDEGLILSRLKHPQIVTIRGQGESQGQRYMTLDFIQGYSLRNLIETVIHRQSELECAWQDLMDPVSATALILSALYPLEYAHRANVHLPDREIFGVAHRDISPGNLILGIKGNEKGKLILIDFGTAKTQISESLTVDQNLVGTVPYMSKARLQKASTPEQMNEHLSFWKDFRETQHDIHALGVLYFQLLTGRLPFSGESSPQIIVQILDPESYSKSHLDIASTFPFALNILRKCLVYHDFSQPLSAHPYQYPNAGKMLPELVQVFDQLSNGQSVQEVLVDLSQKLAEPQNWSPKTKANSARERFPNPHPSARLPTGSKLGFAHKRPSPNFPRPKIKVAIMVAVIAFFCLSSIGFLLFQKKQNQTNPTLVTQDSMDKSPLSVAVDSPSKSKLSSNLIPTSTQPILEKLDAIEPEKSLQLPNTKQNGAKKKLTEIQNLREAFISQRKPSPVYTIKNKSSLAQKKSDPPPIIAVIPALTTSPSPVKSIFTKEDFVLLQTLVREENTQAFDKISSALKDFPLSPDLLLLHSQLLLQTNPASLEARQNLKVLVGQTPQFTHPALFHETTLFQLFSVDAAIYSISQSSKNRMNMQKSGNIYLAEFEPIAAFSNKVNRIKAQLSK